MTEVQEAIVPIAVRVSQWWPSIVSALGAILLVLPGLAEPEGYVQFLPGQPHRLKVLILGAVVTLIGGVALSSRNRHVAELQRERDEAVVAAETSRQHVRALAEQAEEAVRSLGRMELELLARKLRHYSNERISLFAARVDHFVLVARCSLGPRHQTAGRERYPLTEGCLGQAWENGRSAETALPDPGVRPAQWRDEMGRRWNVPGEVAERLTMKSRSYVAFRIDGTPGSNPLGVIVFESLNSLDQIRLPDGGHRCVMDPNELATIVGVDEAARLQGLLEKAGGFYSKIPPSA